MLLACALVLGAPVRNAGPDTSTCDETKCTSPDGWGGSDCCAPSQRNEEATCSPGWVPVPRYDQPGCIGFPDGNYRCCREMYTAAVLPPRTTGCPPPCGQMAVAGALAGIPPAPPPTATGLGVPPAPPPAADALPAPTAVAAFSGDFLRRCEGLAAQVAACLNARYHAGRPSSDLDQAGTLPAWHAPDSAATRLADINRRFREGRPSNSLLEAGVLVRQFDSLDDVDHGSPWLPCPATFWCAQYADRWPATIINAHSARRLYYPGTGGFVLAPTAELLCAYPGDGNSMSHTCPRLGGNPPDGCVPGCRKGHCSWSRDNPQGQNWVGRLRLRPPNL